MNEIGYLVKRVQHALRLKMDKSLEQLDLTLPQYVALTCIEMTAGLSNADLARQAFVTPQTMHRVVRGLEKRGLVDCLSHPQLERVQQLFLTPEGKHLVAHSRQCVASIETQSLAQLLAEEVQDLRVLLQKYLDGIEGVKMP